MIKIKKTNWVEGASSLESCKIYRYIGPTILGKQADVNLIYKNNKSYRIYGDELDVLKEATARISLKKNHKEKMKFVEYFMETWNRAHVYGYSEYKELSGNKNPIETLDPYGLEELQKHNNKSFSELLTDNFYKEINSAKLIQSKLSEIGWDKKDLADRMQQLGKEERQKQSTTYTHLSGERAVSRDVAIEYSKILNCDPVDLMFPKRTSVVWGKVNTRKAVETYKTFIPGEIYPYTAEDKDMEKVIVPRDIWKKNIKAIKIDARGTIFDQHVGFYYFSNSKDEACMNKLCVVGATLHPEELDPDYAETNYYLGLYENNQGISNLINVDPFTSENNKYILRNFEPNFISPIVCMINPKMIIDETAKQGVLPESDYRKEEVLIHRLHIAREHLKTAEANGEKTKKILARANKIMEEAKEIQTKLLKEQDTQDYQLEKKKYATNLFRKDIVDYKGFNKARKLREARNKK